jgi:hypothetical protein
MLLYSVKSEGDYLTFTGLTKTLVEGIIISHRKQLIKKVQEDISRSTVLLVDINDISSEYAYYEVKNPSTGFAFSSLSSFLLYIITELNNVEFDSNLFIDNWDAVANKPVLTNGALYDNDGDSIAETVAPNSFYFIVTNADTEPSGNTTLNGENSWTVGDIVRSTGTKWVRQPCVTQVAAFNVSYVNTVGSTDSSWNTIDEVQGAIDELYSRVQNFNGTLASLDDTDFETTAPVEGDTLLFNGSGWVPGTISGRDYVYVIADADGTTTAPSVDGNYILKTGTSSGWVPPTASVNDVLNLNEGTWSLLYDVSEENPGALEVEYTASPRDGSNYVWTGTVWEDIDAYEPSVSLDSVLVANNNLGDISDPPYGAPSFRGNTLRGRSISKILDDIIFSTTPHTYNGPSLSVSRSVGGFGNFERGTDITGLLTTSYTKNDGGDLDNTDPSHPGGDEIKLELVVGSDSLTKVSNTHASGNRSLSIDANSEIDTNIPDSASTSAVGYLRGTAITADGDAIADNKGNDTPRNSGYGDNTLAQTLTSQQNFYSRYPIWIGHTTQRFTIGTTIAESTDITIDPNSGSNQAGTKINNTWLQGAGSAFKRLFTSNISQDISISPSSGDAHILIICPPGITVQSIQESVAGQWVSMTFGSNYSVFDLTGITSLNGLEPKTYKCYYLRDLSNPTFSSRTLRFTTTGTITV